ncbi:Down syndrome cell adhesion molecule-like protein 1 [Sarcoptes scabiei]|nr:Down syndrome cell adhesion molecule-like protein 1 [Sarcoptes scabiei]
MKLIFNNSILILEKPIILRPSQNHRATVNGSYVLQCVIKSGSQPIFFEWSKNNHPLTSSIYKIDTHKTLSLLTMEHLQPNASGFYKCIARNVYGSDFIEIHLEIQGLLSTLTMNYFEELNRDDSLSLG